MHTDKILSENLFPVVGIGASAGGLDAFKRFIKAIPQNSGMAYILVQHLDPAHESILTDLLQKVTNIPVREITDNIKVVEDHIYIIPSNKILTATDGVLKLTPRFPKQKNMPIDVFFISLAEIHQSHAIGVVLSGTATDGTLGLKAIKDHGGVTFAQDHQSAAYNGMPQSAIEAEVVDFILAPEKIPEKLMALKEPLISSDKENDADTTQMLENGFKQILALLRVRRGVDFTYYKQTTIRRRITRRMALSMKTDIAEYIAYLKKDTAEQDTLFQDLLIPVTEFFRDAKVFDALCETVFPLLLGQRQTNQPIRVWIAGCSTGEEVYSVVMCLHEYLGDKASAAAIQVFATDISEMAITKARSGLYMKTEVAGLSTSRLEQFFTKTDGHFRVNKSVRDSCVFAFHNYLKDPPFANMDMISCRNSLIYLEPFLQKKALTTFHYALKEKGYLVLGRSETTGQATELYNSFDKNNKIYTRKPVSGKFMLEIARKKDEIFRNTDLGFGKIESLKDDFQKNADEVLLARYAPPGVVITAEMDIVQFRGATGAWLEPSPGKPSLNVLKMARDGLGFELRNALHKVKRDKKAFVKEFIPIQFMEKERLVTIEVIPLLNTIEQYFLILFRDTVVETNTGQNNHTGGETVISHEKQKRDQNKILRLEKELAQAREDMRSITEDQEASNEELQSANEELLSGSEELQTLNEELETSKEETQTSIEELIIVNQELYDRNEQLNLSRLYAESIVSTIREPLLILNKNLHIRSANKSFYTKFQTSAEETEGVLLFDLGNKQWNIPRLREMLEKVLPEKASIDEFEVTHTFPGLGRRIMLVNASRIVRDNNEDKSILLAIEDVTEKRKADTEMILFAEEMERQVLERTNALHEANHDLAHSNKSLEQFAYIASHDLQEPLRKITTFSTLLSDLYKDDVPEKAKELIHKITVSARRMSDLIRDLLNFSKVVHNTDSFKKSDLNVILKNVLDDFDLLITEKKAVIKAGKLPELEVIPFQLNQLFCNLISNALKFSKKEEAPEITITSNLLTAEAVKKLKGLNQAKQYYEICFSDNGIGFDEKYANQIFVIFQRLHGREHFTGTGIGLALCKTIAINHHGEIYGTSVLNKGARFHVILPVTRET